jgi:diacylglycerol kinase (ATP)
LKRKGLFIINPVAGGKNKDHLPELIEQHLDKEAIELTIVFTEEAGHAHWLAKEAAKKYDLIVAVGGDGTVNEVASAVAGSKAAFGIIPFGSGNGLSRFLGIPMGAEKAIKNINLNRTEIIDAGKLNGNWFFNMAGMGFDAHISQVFAQQKTRGFMTYLKASIREVLNYKTQSYHLEIDGKGYDRDAFMLNFANSSQFGNNAFISPHASVQDGLLDVCIIKPFPLYRFPDLCFRMFANTADKTKYVEIIRGKHIRVKRNGDGPVHLDGEPETIGAEADILIVPHALKIVVGDYHKK